MIYHIGSIILAYIIDLIVGDPIKWPHPVKGFGKVISFFDKRWNKGINRKFKGLVMIVILIILVFTLSLFVVIASYEAHALLGMAIEAILISTTIAQKGLRNSALEVVEPLQANNIQEAKRKLSYIVGRDTVDLSEQEIVRGTVETVAENTSDGITVPLFWSFIGGAPLALVYRAVNTSDSMVGYKNKEYESFGWASAKLDDIVNWIPARLTGIVMMFTMKPIQTTWKEAWSILFRDARKHTSPNSGWCEAAVASLLGIQLGGTNFYKGIKSTSMTMGDHIFSLKVEHVLATIKIMKRTVFLFLLLIVIGGIIIELAYSWI